MRKIYLSGPMTGLPENNFPAFHAEAARLRSLGYEVVNPAEINAGLTLGHHEYMISDIKALCDCDTIALLPGWEESKGAQLEVQNAQAFKFNFFMASEITEPQIQKGNEIKRIGEE